MGNSGTDSRLQFSLTEEQKSGFHKVLKIAIYKELHRQKKITDTQLNKLIQMQDK